MEVLIRQLIQEKINPQLALHHGGVQLVAIQGNTLSVRMTGACCGCPSALATLETVVLEGVRQEFPQIEKVEMIQEVSEELLDMARKILNP